ncbi:MAG: acetoacetate decarboxylase family protein [Acidimicrobiales bacterium]
MLPEAPWSLTGEVVVAFVPRPRTGDAAELPAGLKPLPGPAVVWAGHWAQTPVGPFTELAVAVPARLGLRPGLCITMSVVNNADARLAGRLGWGMPRQLGSLRWLAVGSERTLGWSERGIEVGAEVRPGAGPFTKALRGLQRRSDGLVVVPARLTGWVRRARVTIEVEPGDGLEGLAGRRRGWVISGRTLVLEPSRHPRGLLRTLVAPSAAPEPG